MKISAHYLDQNKQLHAGTEAFGTSGHKWAHKANDLSRALKTQSVLDYGCGKGTMQDKIKFPISQYDPAVEEHSAEPEPHDIVMCTDVLEHIEPECLDAVLDDLRRLTKQVGFFVIATRLAIKTLPDGRNAHLIVEPVEWWVEKLEQRWSRVETRVPGPREFQATVWV